MDKDRFLEAALPEAEVVIPGVGEVMVRGLTRHEVLALAALKDDQCALEQRIVHLGLVDPALSEDDVAAWFLSAPAGYTDLIVDEVSRLSAMSKEAPKSGLPGVRGERGARDGVLRG